MVGDPEVTKNICCKSRNLPNMDTHNYSTDLRYFLGHPVDADLWLYASRTYLDISMVLLLDGNSEILAHLRSNFYYMICLRHLIEREQSQINYVFL